MNLRPSGDDASLPARKRARSAPVASPAKPSMTRWPELYVDSIDAACALDGNLRTSRRVQPDNVSTLVRGQGNRIGVVLGLHGLSAGPWQFGELAQAYASRGLDVYTPRMLGHGLRRDGVCDLSDLPDINDQNVYRRYAGVVFDNARAYARAENLPLFIVGHSAGAVLGATQVQARPEDVAGQVYINPLQAPTSLVARLQFAVARLIRHTSIGRWWLRRAQHVFVPDPDHRWPGYPSMAFSKIFPMLNLARNVWASFTPTAVPTMLMVSDADATCDPVPTLKSAGKFFKDLTIHRFALDEAVGHAAVSAIENPRDDIRKIIYDKSGAFLVACATKQSGPPGPSTENT